LNQEKVCGTDLFPGRKQGYLMSFSLTEDLPYLRSSWLPTPRSGSLPPAGTPRPAVSGPELGGDRSVEIIWAVLETARVIQFRRAHPKSSAITAKPFPSPSQPGWAIHFAISAEFGNRHLRHQRLRPLAASSGDWRWKPGSDITERNAGPPGYPQFRFE
jgi:hypothetical protein